MKINLQKTCKQINSNFKESKKYLFSTSKHIYFIIGLFLFFALLGFFIKLPEQVYTQILNYFEQILNQTKDLTPIQLILFLLQNNLFASFLGILLGAFFGIFTIITAALNGFVLGFASNISVLENGIFSLWKLLPHGIFELPALFISLGLGTRLGTEFIKKYFKTKKFHKQLIIMFGLTLIALTLFALMTSLVKELSSFLAIFIFAIGIYLFLKDKKLKKHFINSITTFIYIVIPLLIIAAIIEGILVSIA